MDISLWLAHSVSSHVVSEKANLQISTQQHQPLSTESSLKQVCGLARANESYNRKHKTNKAIVSASSTEADAPCRAPFQRRTSAESGLKG